MKKVLRKKTPVPFFERLAGGSEMGMSGAQGPLMAGAQRERIRGETDGAIGESLGDDAAKLVKAFAGYGAEE